MNHNVPISAYLGKLEIDLGELPEDTFKCFAAAFNRIDPARTWTESQVTRHVLEGYFTGIAKMETHRIIEAGRRALLAQQMVLAGEIEIGRAVPE